MMGGLGLDLIVYILERVVTRLHSGCTKAVRFPTILEFLSLLLTELLNVRDRII
jgi:hypothetical protein